jgi:Rho-binding antiterminator
MTTGHSPPGARLKHQNGTDRVKTSTWRIRMSNDRYEPVSCDYHDQLEAAAMHKQVVELEFDLEGVTQRERGKIEDVYTADGAEFVRFAADSGPLEIRLDHIIAVKE